MRDIPYSTIADAVCGLYQQANLELGEDVLAALRAAAERESVPLARQLLEAILENAEIARREGVATCQDTGYPVVFCDLGQEAHVVGGPLEDAVNEGLARACRDGYLRASLVRDPLDRATNTGNNTPCVLHARLVAGDRLTIHVAAKGGGSENMSALWMLTPAQGRAGVIARIVERVREAGGRPCPPLILGVGLGGTFEYAAVLAKRALLRTVGEPHPDPGVAELEREVLAAVNATGVGPMGIGGDTTALAVHLERYPCHIASLPLALNVQCHAARHRSVVL
jgi:fumarate hydratase subunit alpha